MAYLQKQAISDRSERVGIKKDYYTIINQKEPVKNGDFVAVYISAVDWISFGFYSNFFGIVHIEVPNGHYDLYGAAEIVVLGKIIGYCKSAKSKTLYPLRELR